MAQHNSNNKEYDWLDDPFDEEKAAADLDAMRSAKRRGCIAAVILVIVALIILGAAGCMALGVFGAGVMS